MRSQASYALEAKDSTHIWGHLGTDRLYCK